MICSKGLAITQYFCHKDQSELVFGRLTNWKLKEAGEKSWRAARRVWFFNPQTQTFLGEGGE